MQWKNSTIDSLKGLFIERLAQVMFMNNWYSGRADTVYMFFIFCQLWTWQYVTLYETSKLCEFERWYSDKYFLKIRFYLDVHKLKFWERLEIIQIFVQDVRREYLLFLVVLTGNGMWYEVPPLFTQPFLVFIPN